LPCSRAMKQPNSAEIRPLLQQPDRPLLRKLTIRERPGNWCFRYWQEGGGYDRNLTEGNRSQPGGRFSLIAGGQVHLFGQRVSARSSLSAEKWTRPRPVNGYDRRQGVGWSNRVYSPEPGLPGAGDEAGTLAVVECAVRRGSHSATRRAITGSPDAAGEYAGIGRVGTAALATSYPSRPAAPR